MEQYKKWQVLEREKFKIKIKILIIFYNIAHCDQITIWPTRSLKNYKKIQILDYKYEKKMEYHERRKKNNYA